MTSSARMAHLASKAMRLKKHGEMTIEEIRELGASVESQRQDVSTRPATAHPDKQYGPKNKVAHGDFCQYRGNIILENITIPIRGEDNLSTQIQYITTVQKNRGGIDDVEKVSNP